MELFDKFQTFVYNIPASIATTNISKIREEAKFITPLVINNDDTDENFRKISVVAIQNLLNYHSDTEMFNVSSLKLLIDLLRTDDVIDSVKKSKLIVLLHGTKLRITSETLCSWFIKIKQMKVIVIEDDHNRLFQWKTIASMTLKHPAIISAITHLACKCTGLFQTSSFPPVEVEIINCTLAGLRGFCGINKIYINAAYIRGQMSIFSTSFHPNSTVGESVVQMDISTIAIHELGHLILRQITNNPNICTPDVLNQQTSSTMNETAEFGRMSETIFFGGQIDYWETAANNHSNAEYFESFMQAIKSQLPLPNVGAANNFIQRTPSVSSGLDIELDREDIYI